MLVTSRETQRWVIPKGWPQAGRSPCVVAAREAREEAGVMGRIGKHPIGKFLYEKRLSAETSVVCEVTVFMLEVHKQYSKWPEMAYRQRLWLSPADAALLVIESGLREILLCFDKNPLVR